jgi:hypothetical protein
VENESDNPYPLFDMSLLKDRIVLAVMLIGIFTGMILSLKASSFCQTFSG